MHKLSTVAPKPSGVLHRQRSARSASSTYRTVRLRGPTRKQVAPRVAQRTQAGVFGASLRKPMNNPGSSPKIEFNLYVQGDINSEIDFENRSLRLLPTWCGSVRLTQPAEMLNFLTFRGLMFCDIRLSLALEWQEWMLGPFKSWVAGRAWKWLSATRT